MCRVEFPPDRTNHGVPHRVDSPQPLTRATRSPLRASRSPEVLRHLAESLTILSLLRATQSLTDQDVEGDK